LSQSGSTMNLINIYDFGREVQQSYYSGPANFVPQGAVQNPNWSPFPWNPIQVGDSFGYRAAVLAYSNSGGTIYVKTRPMQWALRNYPSDCIMEQWTRLDGPAVRVHCKLTNQRADHTRYPPYGQELPAAYGVGTLCHIFSYTGTAPFTGGALTQLPNAPPPNWTRWRATENWSAMVNSSNFGFGVHNPDSVFTTGGYHDFGNPCTGGPTDDNTTYIAPIHTEVLDHNIVYEYDFNLIVGTLTSIRNWVYTHRSDHRPDYHFGTSRQHWLTNYGDAGVPSGFLRANLNGPDPSLGGPNTAFAASACPQIYFAARYVMSSPPVEPRAELFWETNNSGGFSETRKQSVSVIPDGRWRIYSFNVGANAAWSGLISQLRLDPIQSGGPGDYVDIAWISYQNAGAPPGLNLQPAPLSGWAGPIIVNKKPGKNTDVRSLKSSDTLYVSWAELLTGTEATSVTFYSQLYVDDVLVMSWPTMPPLNPDEPVAIRDFSIGHLSPGKHKLTLVVDSFNLISETDETDNSYTKIITVKHKKKRHHH
jgi:CARDB